MAGFLIIAITAAVALLILQTLRALALSRARAKFAKENGCKPPRDYPHKVPYLGLDYTIETKRAWDESRMVEKMEEDYVKYGPTFRLVQFGQELFATIQPENLKAVFSIDFDNWGIGPGRGVSMRPLFGDSFANNDGGFFKWSRSLTRPPLSKSEVANLSLIEFHWQRLFAKLPKDGSTVDIQPLLELMIQDFTSDYLFGESIGSLDPQRSQESKELQESLGIGMRHTFIRLLMGDLVKILPASRTYLRASTTVHKYLDRQIDKALHRRQEYATKDETRHVFIDDILDETQDKRLIRATTMALFGASNDTTSFTLGTVLFFLSRHPKVLARLREEVLTVVGENKPDAAALSKMPYLRAVIFETLRVRHVAAAALRHALKDTTLPVGGGPDGQSPIFVKKGSAVLVNWGAIGREKSVWGPDAEEFRPERLLQRDLDPWMHLPFGAGKRICPGQTFALTNMQYTLVRLLQEFKDIQSRDDKPWTEKISFGISNKHGVLVGLIPA